MELNNKELNKLGDALEDLTNSVMNKDMENALNTFKILKENKYSVFMETNKVINKDNYNEVKLEINEVKLDLDLKK
jgi:hypothetical protein